MGLKELIVLRIARRWISGTDLPAAIDDAKRANSSGMGCVVNFLGEDIKDLGTADSHTNEYLRVQQAIADNGIDGFVSVKLTQFGILLNPEEASIRLEKVAANADRLKQKLWLDMERSSITGSTLSIYEAARQKHPDTGVALQAYMRRSESDLKSILDNGGHVRLVKGAYREPKDVVLPTRSEVRENYTKLMAQLFEQGHGFAIATHDSTLIGQAKKLAESSHADFHFEMLKGIRDELKTELVSSGYKMVEYLPYGDQWYSYSKRRISEHPSNIWLLLRSLV